MNQQEKNSLSSFCQTSIELIDCLIERQEGGGV